LFAFFQFRFLGESDWKKTLSSRQTKATQKIAPRLASATLVALDCTLKGHERAFCSPQSVVIGKNERERESWDAEMRQKQRVGTILLPQRKKKRVSLAENAFVL